MSRMPSSPLSSNQECFAHITTFSWFLTIGCMMSPPPPLATNQMRSPFWAPPKRSFLQYWWTSLAGLHLFFLTTNMRSLRTSASFFSDWISFVKIRSNDKAIVVHGPFAFYGQSNLDGRAFFACHRAKDGTKGQNFGVLGDYLGG